ncbi:MAG TPA: N-acetylmuramoyl-L-alanine amidase [Kofleriaceae bacterium]|nr:N-acetylmuramoyl-L-alanine amidase [Kofleriaceae bacterium]
MRVIIDPGHGGDAPNGRSTPYGARGPGGTLERDVVLQLSQMVAAELGGAAQLTRYGNAENPSLTARAEQARRAGASVFVSLHANHGGPGARGTETWIHDRADRKSETLAAHIQRSLIGAGCADGGIGRGALGVLSPERHAGGTAACLVEVDYLSDPYAERRLGDPRELGTYARAIAQGIRAYGQYDNWFTDADAVGVYHRVSDTNVRSTKPAAHAVVTELRGWSGTSPWRHLQKATVCDRLDHLIDHWDFSQLGTPLCGPASFFTCWAMRDPVAFARHASEMYRTGSAGIGASYRVTAGSSLLAQDYAAANTSSGNRMPPQADWMLMGAIRSSEDDVFVWDGSRAGGTLNVAANLAGLTFPEEIVRWFNATGLYRNVTNRMGTGAGALSSKGYPAASALEPGNGKDIVCLVQGNAFRNLDAGNSGWPLSEFPSHYVVLLGKPLHQNARPSPEGSPIQITHERREQQPDGTVLTLPLLPHDSVSFKCWSYGEIKRDCYSPSMSEFAYNYYGAIIAEMT